MRSCKPQDCIACKVSKYQGLCYLQTLVCSEEEAPEVLIRREYVKSVHHQSKITTPSMTQSSSLCIIPES